jgi:hypothetical protein
LTWAEIIDELHKNSKVKKSFIGYLDYIRDRRNEAQHPDKRFSQEEGEQILLHVKSLMEAIL